MADVRLNWTTARVKDAKLTVELAGEIPRGWKQSFETTERLLAGGADWGEIRVKKQSVRIDEVNPGQEEKLRHHLESLVEQANAAVRPREKECAEPDAEDDRDAEMAARFRAFAGDTIEE